MSLLLEAIAYVRAGLPVFPCHSIVDDKCSCGKDSCSSPGKHPRTPNGSHDATLIVDQVNEWWHRWPDASIALATGSASDVFVVDIDRRADRDGFLWLEAVSGDMPSGPKATTPSGGAHLFFAIPEGMTVANSSDQVCRGVDIRGEGGYVIAAPSTGMNGSEYVWEDDIREFEPAAAPEWLLTQIASSATVQRGQGAARWRISDALDDHKKAEISDALKHINSSSRDKWLRIGMAIHSRFANEDGFDLWDEWSQTTSGGNYDARDQRYTWDRFDSYGGVGIETLFFMANDAGWRGLVDEPTEDEVVPWEDVYDDRTDAFPPELIDGADGLMGAIVDWMNDTAVRRSPVLSFAATLTFMGTIYGRKFQSKTGIRTNLYTLGIAPPGYGKEHARQCIKRLLVKSGSMDLLGGEDIASAPGLMKALAHRPVQLFLLDEFGEVLKKIASNRAASWERDLSSLLLRLYSSAGTTMRGREVAHTARVDVNQPHACLYGTSTPLIYEAIGSSAIAGGLMSRILVFHVDGNRGARQSRTNKEPPEFLVNAVRNHLMGGEAEGGGVNLSYLPFGEPNVETVEETAACAAVWAKLEKIADKKIMGRDGDLWARLEEHAIRLALIRALSRSSPVIEAQDAEWGSSVALWCLNRAAAVVEERVADSTSEANTKAVLAMVRKAGARGISKSALTKRLFRLGKRQREEAIGTLVESHDVIMKLEGRATKYYAVRQQREAV